MRFFIRITIYLSSLGVSCLVLFAAKGTYSHYYGKITVLNTEIDKLQEQLSHKKSAISEIKKLRKMKVLLPLEKNFQISNLKSDLKTDTSLIKFKSSGNVKIVSYIIEFSFVSTFEYEVYKVIDYLDTALPGYVSTISLNIVRNDKKDENKDKSISSDVTAKFQLLWFYLAK
jgi:hypothetical protein